MTVRAVEGKQPYTGGTAIEIDENKVISLRLRDENNLIIYDEGDDEIYVDLQLPDEITPTDAFPVGVTTGRVIVDNGWDTQGTLICAKTTSGDNIKILYADDGKLYMDNGTGSFKQIYFKADVDLIIQTLTTYINGELAKKQNGVTSDTAPSNPSEGDLWYDTVHDALKVYNGTTWVATGTGGSGDVVVSPDTGNELSTGVGLWFGTESDFSSISTPDSNTLYIQYKSEGGGGGWQPGVNTVLYMPLDGDVVDYSAAGRTFTVYGASASVGNPVFDTLANGKKVADFTASDDKNSNRFAFTSDVTNIPMSGNMTISFWMNWTGTTNGYQNIVTLRETSNYTWLTVLDLPSNSSKFMFHGSTQEKTTFTPTTGTWYNMVCTVDNGTCYVYKDGVQIYSDSYTYGGVSAKVCLCGYYFPSNPSYRSETYNGKLSEVIIENVAWSAQDVSDYYDLTKSDYGIS